MIRTVLTLLLTLAPLALLAQTTNPQSRPSAPGGEPRRQTVTLTLPAPSGFAFSFSNAPSLTTEITAKTTAVALPQEINGVRLQVIDLAKNRLASRDLPTLAKDGSWAPKPDEFKNVAKLTIALQPLAGVVHHARLQVTAPGFSFGALVSADDKNQVTIYDLPAKPMDVVLEYASPDGKKTTGPQTIDPGAQTLVTLPVPESFVEPSAAQASSEPASPATTSTTPTGQTPDPAEETRNPFATLVQMLVGLAVVGGLAYAAFWYYKNNTQVVEKLAAQAGINPANTADPTGALPPEPVKRELQKIQLPGSSPLATTTDTPAGLVATSAAVAKNPRLVTAAGDVVLLAAGETTVGREDATLTLPSEASVSRRHAILTRAGDSVTLADLGSTNGTYLNGTKTTTPTVLTPGDHVQFGAVAYRYEE